MKEKDILHQNGDFWVCQNKKTNLYLVMCPLGMISVSETTGYADLSLAIARCDYKAKSKKT